MNKRENNILLKVVKGIAKLDVKTSDISEDVKEIKVKVSKHQDAIIRLETIQQQAEKQRNVKFKWMAFFISIISVCVAIATSVASARLIP